MQARYVIHDQDQFTTDMADLPADKRWGMLMLVGSNMKDFMREMDSGENKIDFVSDILKLLPAVGPNGERVVDFASLYIGEVENGYDLACLVEHLPSESRGKFIKPCLDKIENIDQLVRVLEHVPQSNYRSKYIKHHKDKITNGDDLARLSKFIVGNYAVEAFAREHIGLVKKETELVKFIAAIAGKSSPDLCGELVASEANKIQSPRVLSSVLFYSPRQRHDEVRRKSSVSSKIGSSLRFNFSQCDYTSPEASEEDDSQSQSISLRNSVRQDIDDSDASEDSDMSSSPVIGRKGF